MTPRLMAAATALGAALALLAPAGASAATTLGITSVPSGAQAVNGCGSTSVVAQATDDPATPFIVPAGGGQITGWQTLTTGATPGAPVTLVVLRPAGAGSYHVVATDSETLPNPLPADGKATFPLLTPVAVSGGETFGLYTGSNSGGAVCFFHGGSTPAGDTLTSLGSSSPPTAGETLSPDDVASPGGYVADLAVTLQSTQDAGVTASAGPADPTTGNLAQLGATIVNHGPASGPIRLIDNVPSGLMVVSAVAGSGGCSTISQQVVCTISGLAPGQSAPVTIDVTPSHAGTYENTVTVAPISGADDPDSANDSASATLTVKDAQGYTPPPVTPCVVPMLRLAPLAVVRSVLPLLHCRVGVVQYIHTKSIAKGVVFRTTPGQGVFAQDTAVALQVSAGPRHHKRRRAARGRRSARPPRR